MLRMVSILALAAPTLAWAKVPDVVVDIPPVHALVAQVMGDLGQPTLLLEPGADAHGYALRPSQARNLQNADLVVWLGPQMTPWMERALANIGAGATTVSLLRVEGTFLRSYGDEGGHSHEGHDHHDHKGHDHDHEGHKHHDHKGHDHDHEGHNHHDHDHEGHGHDHDHDAAAHGAHEHSGLDPHAWLDPANPQIWLEEIARQLAVLDPQNGETYAANAQKARAQIVSLDQEVQATLAAVQGKPFVVGHDAYGYFTGHYGLQAVGAVALGDASSAGAQHLQDLRKTLLDKGVICAFPEQGAPSKQLEVVIEGTPVRLGGALDPEGVGFQAGPALYGDMMRAMAQTLKACLEG